jgi:predicted metal-binding protein
MNDERAVLSICMTCRDGREAETGMRGGSRLAQAIYARINALRAAGVTLRGVECMSQCKRPCIVSLSQNDKFTYVFGDLAPDETAHTDALLELVWRYNNAPEGFLERKQRPELLQANILGRFPPIHSASPLVSHLDPVAAE